jgi:hypothetical protein
MRHRSPCFERFAYWQETPQDWLDKAAALDLDVWLSAQQAQLEKDLAKYGGDEPKRGDWPQKVEPFTSLFVPRDVLSDSFWPAVIIALLPAHDAAEAAAHLRFGGWNQCPKADVHVAFARLWRDRYGAQLVSLTKDVVEFKVARPLTDRDDALKLAMDQYHYCTDSVPVTIEAAAAELIGSTVWHFWWD